MRQLAVQHGLSRGAWVGVTRRRERRAPAGARSPGPGGCSERLPGPRSQGAECLLGHVENQLTEQIIYSGVLSRSHSGCNK